MLYDPKIATRAAREKRRLNALKRVEQIDKIIALSLMALRRARLTGLTGNPRTHRIAHDYIANHWRELADGNVIDVEYILLETAIKKASERECYT